MSTNVNPSSNETNYCVELVYPTTSRYLSVKDRHNWRTKRIAVSHARDIAQLRTRDGIMKDLIAVTVWKNDSEHVITFEIEGEQANAEHAELMKIGKGAADSLRSMVAALECDYDRLERLDALRDNWGTDEMVEYEALKAAAGECTSEEEARIRIHNDALSVEVRGDWYSQVDGNDVAGAPVEFQILLSTGGPATRIMGELRNGEPHRAWLEVQDWGTPWTQYHEEGLDDVLLSYANCFYFGE